MKGGLESLYLQCVRTSGRRRDFRAGAWNHRWKCVSQGCRNKRGLRCRIVVLNIRHGRFRVKKSLLRALSVKLKQLSNQLQYCKLSFEKINVKLEGVGTDGGSGGGHPHRILIIMPEWPVRQANRAGGRRSPPEFRWHFPSAIRSRARQRRWLPWRRGRCRRRC